ncbi:MAG: TonB-dependent receptor [Alphaproteobacteria bacterium]|nr:TonB-dependent receptor [Alphaproteobacteria bacterium]
MSISAFSGDQLANQGISTMTDLAQMVPNLTILQTNNNRNSTIMIRGIGSDGSNPGIDPDVGIYLDGVYMPAAGAIHGNLLDISTVEILRGPQGTLYGRNTAVGAVNINTRKPTQQDQSMIDASFGNYNAYRIAGYFGGGLTPNLAGRMSLWVTSHDGYEKNLYNNTPINGSKQYGGRARLLWTPTNDLTGDFTGYYIDITQNCCTVNQVNPTGVGGIATPGFLAAMTAAGHPFINFNGLANHTVDDETAGNDETKMWGLSAKFDLALPWHDTLTSITAYDSFLDNIRVLAADGLPINVASGSQPLWRKTVSEELRITSPSHQFFEYVGGFYYFHEDLTYDNSLTIGSGANRVFPIAGGVTLHPGDANYETYKQGTDSTAVYGQGTANITKSFRITGGLRYSSDHKDASLVNLDSTFGSPLQTLIFTRLLFPVETLPHLSRTDAELTWMTSAQYNVTKSIMTYLTASTGYKDGGFNARAVTPGSSVTFNPETTYNYEFGVKSTLLDHHLVFNIDLYRMILKGFQQSSLDPKTGVGFIVTNAGSQQVQGVEASAHALPFPGVTLSASLAYSDAKFTSYPEGQCPTYPGPYLPRPNSSPAGTCNYAGLTPAFNPKWRWSLTGQIERPLFGDLDWFVIGTLSHVGRQYLDFTLDPRSVQKAYNLVDLRLGVDSERGWRIDLWARNLTNENYYVYEVAQPLGGLVSGGGFAGASGFAGWTGAPRTFGIEASYLF